MRCWNNTTLIRQLYHMLLLVRCCFVFLLHFSFNILPTSHCQCFEEGECRSFTRWVFKDGCSSPLTLSDGELSGQESPDDEDSYGSATTVQLYPLRPFGSDAVKVRGWPVIESMQLLNTALHCTAAAAAFLVCRMVVLLVDSHVYGSARYNISRKNVII